MCSLYYDFRVFCVFGLSQCFFFNDTATTEIYTYGHTLSLHDALPISAPADLDQELRAGIPATVPGVVHTDLLTAGLITDPFVDDAESTLQWIGRSEEHTSELQSLMRNSYAVFCLKKKTNNTQESTHE